MKKIIISLLIVLGYIPATKGQDVLSMVTDARTSAMGDVGLSRSANPFSLYSYAGIIALDSCPRAVGYSFGGWMPSQKIHSQHTVVGYWKPSENHSFSVGVRYFSYPEINSSDNEGNITGYFNPYDLTLDLGYSYAISANLAVTSTLRYVTGKVSDAEGSKAGSALGVDLGLYFSKNRIRAGLVLSDIGTKINYGGDDNSMPARIKVAGGYSLLANNRHAVNGVLEGAYAFLPKHYTGFESGIGVEYIYNNLIAVRTGYRLGNSETNPIIVPDNFGSSLSYTTLGLGLKLWKCSLDASYLLAGSESPVRNSIRLSLEFRF